MPRSTGYFRQALDEHLLENGRIDQSADAARNGKVQAMSYFDDYQSDKNYKQTAKNPRLLDCKRACRWLLLGVLWSGIDGKAGAVDPANNEVNARPNVLLILADDLNTALGCYGHPLVQTPHIDRLASKGIRFERAYCQAPICNPSRASIFSGLRPPSTGVLDNDTPWPAHLDGLTYMPDFFQSLGYYTATIGKVLDHKRVPKQPYWDLEIREWGKIPDAELILERGLLGPNGVGSKFWAKLKGPDEITPDGEVAVRAARALEDLADQSQPFFLTAGFRRPHTPFAVPSDYFGLYPLERVSLPQVPEGYFEKIPAAARNQYVSPDDGSREGLRAYYACVSYVDAQVGVLLDALDRLELWDNTVVVFASDHGYHTGHHGMWHKSTLFEQTLQVPLIVAAPGKRPSDCRGIVELVDLYPTFSEMCGTPPPAALEGTSFVDLLDAPTRTWNNVALTTLGRVGEFKQRTFTGHSLRTDRYRFNEWDGGSRGIELYDFARDPQGLQNVAADPEYGETINNLRSQLHDMLTQQTAR